MVDNINIAIFLAPFIALSPVFAPNISCRFFPPASLETWCFCRLGRTCTRRCPSRRATLSSRDCRWGCCCCVVLRGQVWYGGRNGCIVFILYINYFILQEEHIDTYVAPFFFFTSIKIIVMRKKKIASCAKEKEYNATEVVVCFCCFEHYDSSSQKSIVARGH